MSSRNIYGIVLRRNRRLLVIAGGLAIAGAVTLAAAAAFATALLGAAVLLVALWYQRLWPTRAPGPIRVTDDAILIGDRQLATRDDLGRAQLVQREGQDARVQLFDRRGRRVAILEFHTSSQARSILVRARLDAAHSVNEFVLAWHPLGTKALLVPLVIAGWALLGMVPLATAALLPRMGPPWLAPTVALALTLTIVAAGVLFYRASHIRLRVGPDGVHERQLGHDRFYSHEEILAIERWPEKPGPYGSSHSHGFDIVLTGGRRVQLRTGPIRAREGQSRGDFIADAVAEARRAGGGTAPQPIVALQRGSRPVEDWLRYLETIGSGEGGAGYRAAAPPREHLWEVIESPPAAPSERLASAVVLCAGRDPAACRRLRRAANAVARPALRAGLEAASGGERARLERALDDITSRCAEGDT